MNSPHRPLDRRNRPRKMPQDRRSPGRTTRSTSRIGMHELRLHRDEEACASCRGCGKRQTVSHSPLDGADAAHRLHRLYDKLSLKNRLDKPGGRQAS